MPLSNYEMSLLKKATPTNKNMREYILEKARYWSIFLKSEDTTFGGIEELYMIEAQNHIDEKINSEDIDLDEQLANYNMREKMLSVLENILEFTMGNREIYLVNELQAFRINNTKVALKKREYKESSFIVKVLSLDDDGAIKNIDKVFEYKTYNSAFKKYINLNKVRLYK